LARSGYSIAYCPIRRSFIRIKRRESKRNQKNKSGKCKSLTGDRWTFLRFMRRAAGCHTGIWPLCALLLVIFRTF